jgi:dipeptidyl aminopeptidase/acylaminoacyl peptidase
LAADLRVLTEPQLAPDGDQVAFCVAPLGHRETQRTSAIWMTPTNGSGAPRSLTGVEHNNVAPRWSPDGASLAFLSDRPKRGEAQLHRVSAAGSEPVRLTDIAGGVASPAWSPDGRLLFVTARRAALAAQDEPKLDNIKVAHEAPRPRAIAAVAATGGAAWQIGPAEGHVWSYALSPDSTTFAALVSASDELITVWDGVELVLFDRDGGNERRLLRLTSFPDQLSWSPDSRFIALTGAQLPDPGDERVYVVNAASGEATTLDPRGMTPSWAGFQGDDLLVLSVAGQRTLLERTDPAGSEWETLDLDPSIDGGWIDGLAVAANSHGITMAVAQPDRPADLWFASRDGAAARLTDLNPQLDGVAFAQMEALTWQGADGLALEGWLLRPPGRDAEERLPLVVDVHGGPSGVWGNKFHGTWHDWGQALAARGFAVLLPNPRGSTGRGGAFTGANRHDFGGRDLDDILRGVDLLVERGVADPQRLGIGGWSYGGFMTTYAITQTNRFKVAVAGAAPTNWVSKVGTTDIGPFNEWNVGVVAREPDLAWERSPIRYLSRVTTPTLVVHGEADKRVPVTQGIEFYQGLKSAGVETEFISYPRQEHSFHERAAQLDLLQRVVAWFERFLL